MMNVEINLVGYSHRIEGPVYFCRVDSQIIIYLIQQIMLYQHEHDEAGNYHDEAEDEEKT